MARGGYRPGAGRPKGSGRACRVAPAIPAPAEVPAKAIEAQGEVPAVGAEVLPLAYMLAVINDSEADETRRDRMAIAAAPFLHPKSGESGKKEQRQEAAGKVSKGKFAPAPGPRLVVNNK